MAIYKIINSLLAVSAASDADHTSEQSHNLSGFADYDDAVPNALDRGDRALGAGIVTAILGGAASGVAAVAADKGIEHLGAEENSEKVESIVQQQLDIWGAGGAGGLNKTIMRGKEYLEKKENRDKVESIVKGQLEIFGAGGVGGLTQTIIRAINTAFKAVTGNGVSIRGSDR